MDKIVDQIQSLVESLDDAGRGQIVKALDYQRRKLETPFHTLHRFLNGQITLAVAVAGADMGFFQALIKTPDGLTAEQMAESSHAAPDLAAKLLRFLAASGLIDHRDDGCFLPNDLTRALTDPDMEGLLRFFQGLMGPCVQAFPAHLKEQKYCPIDDMTTTSTQVGFNTKKPFFEFLKAEPELSENFHKAMKVPRTMRRWFNVFPMEKELETWDQSKSAFVDIGGSHGQACIALKEKYPNLGGHLVLQDLPETIEAAGSIDGVQTMIHDFFEPQPVKDAKFYYLRHVLHDWSDATCEKILKNIIPSMSPNSRILIDDVVIPDVDAPWMVTQEDIIILSCLGTKERTRGEWEALVSRTGLHVVDVFTYSRPSGSSVIMAALT